MNDQTITLPRPGDRLRAVSFAVAAEASSPGHTTDSLGVVRDPAGVVVAIDDNLTVPPRTLGTVDSIDGANQIHVRWDNGSRLALIPGLDQWETAGDE